MSCCSLQTDPVTGLPCFGVHPCRTAELLSLLLLPSGNGGSLAAAIAGAHSLEAEEHPLSTEELQAAQQLPGRVAPEAAATGGGAADCLGGAAAAAAPGPLQYLLAWFSVVPAAVGLRLPVPQLVASAATIAGQ